MIADAANHRVVITVEDGLRNGGAGDLFRDKIEKYIGHHSDGVAPCDIRVLGMPRAYVPHDQPKVILRRYGVDTAGIVAQAKAALS